MLLLIALLLREIVLAYITTPIVEKIMLVQATLGGEWIFRSVIALTGILLLVIAIGLDKVEASAKRVYGWYKSFRQPEGQRDLEIHEQQREQDALDAYLEQMQQWVLDANNPLADSQRGDQRRTMARTRTLATLKRLGPNGKRDALQFLREHGLISVDKPVIRLHTADLSNANLADMDLIGTDLSEANLSGADLSRVRMCGFGGNSASWGKAIERGGGPEDLMQPLTPATLRGANLSDAVLTRALLVGCDLISANFAGADLDRADLRAADLRLARNITQGQIEQAYGSSGQQDYMADTLLPDNRKPPQAWEKLLSQQQQERG